MREIRHKGNRIWRNQHENYQFIFDITPFRNNEKGQSDLAHRPPAVSQRRHHLNTQFP